MDENTVHYMEVKSEIDKAEKNRSQGYLGILIGAVSIPAAIFIYWLCGLGMFFGLAGLIMVISNSTKLTVLKNELANILIKK